VGRLEGGDEAGGRWIRRWEARQWAPVAGGCPAEEVAAAAPSPPLDVAGGEATGSRRWRLPGGGGSGGGGGGRALDGRRVPVGGSVTFSMFLLVVLRCSRWIHRLPPSATSFLSFFPLGFLSSPPPLSDALLLRRSPSSTTHRRRLSLSSAPLPRPPTESAGTDPIPPSSLAMDRPSPLGGSRHRRIELPRWSSSVPSGLGRSRSLGGGSGRRRGGRLSSGCRIRWVFLVS
jgi:hypothetical protein